MKITIVYHSADFDGQFCREIARRFLPDAELIGWNFGEPPLPIPDEGNIYVLDLPCDQTFGLEAAPSAKVRYSAIGILEERFAKRLTWIDHHATSIASHPQDIPGYRIDGVAACRLAWQWFTRVENRPAGEYYERPLPEKGAFIERTVSEPLAVRLAGEYDVWTKGPDGNLLPDLAEFQIGLRSRKLEQKDWDELLVANWHPSVAEIERLIDERRTPVLNPDGSANPPVVDELLRNGRLIQSYAQGVDAGTMKKSFLLDFEGLKFLALNTARCNSLTFAARDVPETGHDALMGFFWNGQFWNVSMYHAKHRIDLDLSQIAVRQVYNGKAGGGHQGACGFQAAALPFLTNEAKP